MSKQAFPAHLRTSQGGEVIVRFRDVPEAITGGNSREEALRLAPDALAVALAGYVERKRNFPRPSSLQDDEVLIVPAYCQPPRW
jgi:antitoxin HicB